MKNIIIPLLFLATIAKSNDTISGFEIGPIEIMYFATGICEDESVQLISTCEGAATYTYLWEASGGTLGTPNSPNSTWTPPIDPAITYTVTLTCTDVASGCSAQAVEIIDIDQKLTDGGDISSPDGDFCGSGDPAIFTSISLASGNLGNSVSYQWESDNGGWSDISGANASTYNPDVISQTTSYRRRAFTDGDCSDFVYSDTITLTVTAGVNAVAGADITRCADDPADAIGGVATGGDGGPYTYAWSPATELSATNIASPTTTATSDRTYTVTVTDASGCSATDQVFVDVTSAAASASQDVSVCLGSGVGISASGGTSYAWSPATGLSATNISNPVASPSVTTVYTVTVTINGCTDTDQVTVTVDPLPTASVGGPYTFCGGGDVQLSASGGVSYAWSGGNITAGANTATPTVDAAGTYTVTVTDANGCTDTAQASVSEVNITASISCTPI